MSIDDYRKGLNDLLERAREQRRLEAIPKSGYQVKQLLELAHTNVERTRSLVKEHPFDYDWQIATLWDAIIEASKAALASTGNRLKGAEGIHGDLTQAAAFILAPDRPEEATSLLDVSASWLGLRNQVKYERRGVVGKETRDDILRKASPILKALSEVSSSGVSESPDFEDWDLAV